MRRVHLAAGPEWNEMCVHFGLSREQHSRQRFPCREGPCKAAAQAASPAALQHSYGVGFPSILPGKLHVNCALLKKRQSSGLLLS